MIARGLLLLALLASAAYGLYEIRRWGAPTTHDLISPRQKRLRAWGLFLLLVALALWLNGTFLPVPRTRLALLHSLIYWIVTALCALPLIPLALLDARENLLRLIEGRQRLAQERQDMARDYLHGTKGETGSDDQS